VADAAVIGIPDVRAGERPKAYIVPARQIAAEELIEYVNAQVAPSQADPPARVHRRHPHLAVGQGPAPAAYLNSSPSNVPDARHESM
jgi:acyl-CoA synthetase (AMP-forming)/AMP-acid ligase II